MEATDLHKAKIISGAVDFLLGKRLQSAIFQKMKRHKISISKKPKEALLLRQAVSLCASLIDEEMRLEASFFEERLRLARDISSANAEGKHMEEMEAPHSLEKSTAQCAHMYRYCAILLEADELSKTAA